MRRYTGNAGININYLVTETLHIDDHINQIVGLRSKNVWVLQTPLQRRTDKNLQHSITTVSVLVAPPSDRHDWWSGNQWVKFADPRIRKIYGEFCYRTKTIRTMNVVCKNTV